MLARSLATLLALAPAVWAQVCPATGAAKPGAPFWMQSIKHQGLAPYSASPSTYQVFRNVKDFGAKGDGVTDDTAAINAAIALGSRCGGGTNICPSTTVTPAIIYFEPGTYLVSSPIVALYYSQLIGDARDLPTLMAAPNFTGIAVIDADPYTASGQFYDNTNNFYRSVRNFVLDLRNGPAAGVTGFHWQVSQATSLMNIRVEMGAGSAHQGLFMENGSGGFMGDLIFNGGKYGIWVGNQQFTVRNLTVNGAATAICGWVLPIGVEQRLNVRVSNHDVRGKHIGRARAMCSSCMTASASTYAECRGQRQGGTNGQAVMQPNQRPLVFNHKLLIHRHRKTE